MTPIEIIDQIMKDMPDFPEEWEDWYFYLWKARVRIMDECTVRLSDGDNTYDIPYALQEEFNSDISNQPEHDHGNEDDEFDDWCADFDSKYSKFKV